MVFNNLIWRTLLAPGRHLFRESQTVRHPALACTLTAISIEGPGAFGTGCITDAIATPVQSTGRILRMKTSQTVLRRCNPL